MAYILNDAQTSYSNSDEGKSLLDRYMAGGSDASTLRDSYNNKITSLATPKPDIKKDINSQYDNALTSKTSALAMARDNSINGYQQSIDKLPGQYQPLRDQSDVLHKQLASSISEQLAALGLNQSNQNNSSGDIMSARLMNQTAGQNELNSLNQQQQSDLTNYNNQIAQARNTYDLGVANATGDINSQRAGALVNQGNADRTFDYTKSQDTLANARADAGLTGIYNGNQTIQGKQSDASIAQSNASTEGIKASTAYQVMQNTSYPEEQKLKIAGLISQNAGLELDNAGKAIQNYYAPQIAQGQIDSTKLANAYQALVNNGYPAKEAADIAAIYANIRQGDAQVDIARQNANTAAYNASKSGSSSGTKEETTAAYNDAAKSLLAAQDKGQATTWINTYKNDLIDAMGIDNFNKLVKNNYDEKLNTANDAKYRQANRNT